MWNWIKNYSKSTKKLTLKNIINYFSAKRRKRKAEHIIFNGPEVILPKNKDYQVASWREDQVKKNSPICLEQGYCKECYCDFEDGLLYQDKACEGGCYPDWEESKKLSNGIRE